MSFPLERNMYSTVLEHLPSMLFDSSYAFAMQVPLSYRKVDIGLAPLQHKELESSAARSLSKLDMRQLWLLSITLTCFKASTDYPREHAEASSTISAEFLAHLVSLGLLHNRADGRIALSNWLNNHLGPVVFVELKLKRWKEALKQALFYLYRADMACVVIDGDEIENVQMDRFETAGIGLFAAWPGRIEIKIAPVQNKYGNITYRHFNRLRTLQDLGRVRPKKWAVASVK